MSDYGSLISRCHLDEYGKLVLINSAAPVGVHFLEEVLNLQSAAVDTKGHINSRIATDHIGWTGNANVNTTEYCAPRGDPN